MGRTEDKDQVVVVSCELGPGSPGLAPPNTSSEADLGQEESSAGAATKPPPDCDSRPPNDEALLLAGRYRLLGEVGSGAMGSVFRARDLRANRQVAIKRPKGQGLDSRAQRLRYEGKILARLRGRNVITLLDSGTDEVGTPFIVLDLLDGESLADRLKRGSLSPKGVYQVLLDVLDVLKEAHAEQVILRDIKPSNIFIQFISGGGRQIRVLDFGVAKALDADDEEDIPLTMAGGIVGTWRYMAPEQAMGRPTEKSDLFSLGVTAYKAAVGRLPWTSEALYGADPGRPATVAGLPFPDDFPGPLAHFIRHLMHPDMRLRPRSATLARSMLLALPLERPLPYVDAASHDHQPDDALPNDGRTSRPSMRSDRLGDPRKEDVEAHLHGASPGLRRNAMYALLLLVSAVIAGAAFIKLAAPTSTPSGDPMAPIPTGATPLLHTIDPIDHGVSADRATGSAKRTAAAKTGRPPPSSLAGVRRHSVNVRCGGSVGAADEARHIEREALSILSSCPALRHIRRSADARLSVHIYPDDRDVRARLAPRSSSDTQPVAHLERCLVRRASDLIPRRQVTLSFWTLSCEVGVEVNDD